ncbi:hypothetical protein [Streptomyces sp. MK37H]|uniref:hypothetical protein n=1 Tax=Streptomyces sp. MK37H TaxID=2699117 RepID=UPI001B36A316|nr:hypothetical protein [Streptomyces sp. MK37H]MBP8532510.1 hypothetical protein [Streptomyces sp. MK37H]
MAPAVLCLPLGLVPAAHSAWSLMGVLLLLGAADGCTSVAMNTKAVSVRRRYGRALINSMHAIRGIGAVAGGPAGVATASLGMALTAQLVSVAVLLAVVSVVAARGLLPDGEPARQARLIRIGTLCCAAVLTAALLLGRPGVTLAALVVAGAGIGAVFPGAFTTMGAFTTVGAFTDSARVMGHVGFAGNLGWLLVSPVIGGLSAVVGLPTALGLLAVAAAIIAGLAPVLGRVSESINQIAYHGNICWTELRPCPRIPRAVARSTRHRDGPPPEWRMNVE